MKHLFVLFYHLHTFLPNRTASIDTTKLSHEDDVEIVELFFYPLDASAHHQSRKAILINFDRIAYNGKIDVGYLKDVFVKVALEDALTGSVSDHFWEAEEILTELSY